jgi:putative intracellular protease/amidase
MNRVVQGVALVLAAGLLACRPSLATQEGIAMVQAQPNRVLLVLTSHDKKGDTGQPTGAYLAEVAHPYAVFEKAGVPVDFVSPRGGRPPFDGLEQPDPISRAFLDDRAVQERLGKTMLPGEVDVGRYVAIFYAGGHGTMWDFPDDAGLAKLAQQIYERGGVVAAVCHGPAGLLNVRLSDGRYLVDGKEVSAFTNSEERAVGLAEVVPFLLVDELEKRGARHRAAPDWQPQVVTSGRLVTGQNPASATGVAQAVLAQLPH